MARHNIARKALPDAERMAVGAGGATPPGFLQIRPRRVDTGGATIPNTYWAPQDLDLYLYDESTGSLVTSAGSTVDPNEQVVTSSAVSSPIYKVYRVAGSFTSTPWPKIAASLGNGTGP